MSWYFCASVNPKHYSNNIEQSLIVITEILVPISKNSASNCKTQIKPDHGYFLWSNNRWYHFFTTTTQHPTCASSKLYDPYITTIRSDGQKHCKKIIKKLFLEWYSKKINNKLSLEKKDWGNQNSVWYYDSHTFNSTTKPLQKQAPK